MINLAKLTLLSCFVLCFGFAIGQTDTIKLKQPKSPATKIVTDRAPQAVYFQFGGSGPLMSVNYDRRFMKRLNGPGFVAGAGFWSAYGVSVFSVPVSLNYLLGRKTHFFEVAAGTTFITGTVDDFFDETSSASGFIHHVNAGYRYQPANGGFFCRGGFSPLFGSDFYITSYYLGIGYSF